jgi:hypothetical protein
MPTFPTAANQGNATLRDCTVLALTSDATSATAVSYIGIVKTFSFDVNRDFKDTTSSTDISESGRPVMWKAGKMSISGFTQVTASKFAALFLQGARATLQFTEGASGDVWQFNCRCTTYSKKGSADMTEDTLDFEWDGVPYYAPIGGTPTAIALGT